MARQKKDVPRIGSRPQNRREILLEAAARHIVERGFEAASIRDIAADVGIHPSSIYHHFPSKEDLMLAVYEEGIRRITKAVSSTGDSACGPWGQLEAACAAHMHQLLEGGDVFRALMQETPTEWHHANARVRKLRNGYEAIFVKLLADLPLMKQVDRKILRLMLLGAMNWSYHWYKPGLQSPAALAKEFVSLLRSSVGDRK